MLCKILSPKGVEFEGEAKSFNVKTRVGEITILDHHHPLMTILERGSGIIETASGERREIPIQSGFLEVSPSNELTVLVQ